MPIDYKKYPTNWKSKIRPEILKRAKNKCEQCGVKNLEYGYRDPDGEFYTCQETMDMLENTGYDIFSEELSNQSFKDGNPKPPIRIVLTIAHMDHNILNNDYNNLKALCQRCHLNHDKIIHLEKRKTKKGTAIYKLF
jgi:hypothetical protein